MKETIRVAFRLALEPEYVELNSSKLLEVMETEQVPQKSRNEIIRAVVNLGKVCADPTDQLADRWYCLGDLLVALTAAPAQTAMQDVEQAPVVSLDESPEVPEANDEAEQSAPASLPLVSFLDSGGLRRVWFKLRSQRQKERSIGVKCYCSPVDDPRQITVFNSAQALGEYLGVYASVVIKDLEKGVVVQTVLNNYNVHYLDYNEYMALERKAEEIYQQSNKEKGHQ